MTDDQKRLNKAIQLIQHVVNGFKDVLTDAQRMHFNQKMDEQFKELKKDSPAMTPDQSTEMYELFESLKVRRSAE